MKGSQYEIPHSSQSKDMASVKVFAGKKKNPDPRTNRRAKNCIPPIDNPRFIGDIQKKHGTDRKYYGTKWLWYETSIIEQKITCWYLVIPTKVWLTFINASVILHV